MEKEPKKIETKSEPKSKAAKKGFRSSGEAQPKGFGAATAKPSRGRKKGRTASVSEKHRAAAEILYKLETKQRLESRLKEREAWEREHQRQEAERQADWDRFVAALENSFVRYLALFLTIVGYLSNAFHTAMTCNATRCNLAVLPISREAKEWFLMWCCVCMFVS